MRVSGLRAHATKLLLLWLLWLSACEGGPRPDCEADGAIRTYCGFENPEDLAFPPGREALVVSQMRRGGRGGSLATWVPGDGPPRRLWPLATTPGLDEGPRAGDPACAPPSPEAFAPHGVFTDRSGLYVVNHGGRESVEIFRLDGLGEDLGARWIGCIELPSGTSGNDVAVGPRGEIVVSNTAPPGQQLRASLVSAFGMATGNVLTWQAGEGFGVVPNTEASAANGVALDADAERIYFAESGAGRVVRVRLDGSERIEIPIPGRPDNLAWSPSGELLVGSHLSFLSLARCLLQTPCRAPWAIFAVDPQSLRVRRLLEHDGSRIGAVAGATPVGSDLYLSAVFGDRIGAWTPDPGGEP